MDSPTPSLRSCSTSPFPIIVNSETLSGSTQSFGCENCEKLKLTIRNAFERRASSIELQNSKSQCCTKNKLPIDYTHYRQKLHWLYECRYCEYRSLYSDDIDRHLSTEHSLIKSEQVISFPENPLVSQSEISLAELDTPDNLSRQSKESVSRILVAKSFNFNEDDVVASPSVTVSEAPDNLTPSASVPSADGSHTEEVDKPIGNTINQGTTPVISTPTTRKGTKRRAPAKNKKVKSSAVQPKQDSSNEMKPSHEVFKEMTDTLTNCVPVTKTDTKFHMNTNGNINPSPNGDHTTETSKVLENNQSNDLSVAQRALLSPIQTMNLSEFSDVLGLEQISNTKDAGKWKTAYAGESQNNAKRSQSDALDSVPLPKFKKTYKSSRNRTFANTSSAFSTAALAESVTSMLLPKICSASTVHTLSSSDLLKFPCYNGSLIPSFVDVVKGPILQLDDTTPSSDINSQILVNPSSDLRGASDNSADKEAGSSLDNIHAPPNSDHLYSIASPPRNSQHAGKQSSVRGGKQTNSSKTVLSRLFEPKLALIPLENILGKDLLREKYNCLNAIETKDKRKCLNVTARKSTGGRRHKKSNPKGSIDSMPTSVKASSSTSFSKSSMLPPVAIMSPLHITTDCSSSVTSISPVKRLSYKEMSNSSADEDDDPWPSPRDQELLCESASSKSNEKLIRDNSAASFTSTPHRQMSTPLLTIGRCSATPESFSMSPNQSTSSKMSGRYPPSKRITKEIISYALTSFCLPDTAKLFPVNKNSPVRSLVSECAVIRSHSTVKFVHDKRSKCIKHNCRPALEINSDISLNNSAIEDEEVAVSNVWPGPSSSDEERELSSTSCSQEALQLPSLQTSVSSASIVPYQPG